VGVEPDQVDNAEKSGRITAWSRLVKALSLLIWSIIGFIILGYLGYYFFVKGPGSHDGQSVKPAAPRQGALPPLKGELDKAVMEALENAQSQARKYALVQLDEWDKELRRRVDTDFLEWYFGYWNTQVRGAKALLDGVVNWVDSDQPTAQEKLTETFQREFTVRVLRPKTSQLQLERIQRETLVAFLNNFRQSLDEIPKKYNIAAPDWDMYINSVSQQSSLVEPGRQVPITLKAIYAAGVGGTVALAVKILPSLKTGLGIGAKMGGKMAGKAGASIAAKTGGKIAGKLGGEFLGPIVGVGIIVWDVWDHHNTVKENRPLLKENIYSFLDEMKLAVLDDPATGVMSPVYQIEEQLRNSLAASQAGHRSP